jgi:hypothetical protein
VSGNGKQQLTWKPAALSIHCPGRIVFLYSNKQARTQGTAPLLDDPLLDRFVDVPDFCVCFHSEYKLRLHRAGLCTSTVLLRFTPARMNNVFLLSMVGFAVLTGCQLRSAPSEGPARVIEQWSGPRSGTSTGSARVLQTAQDWTACWETIGRPPPRLLDPSHEMAVALFLGERRTGGFSIQLVEARIAAESLVVTYREITPPAGAMVSQSLTSPWLVAVLERSDSPVVFRKDESRRK